MTLDDITLSDNLVWLNEYEFSEIEQVAERSVTGGLLIQEGQKLFGRPINLGSAWLTRSTVDTLKTREAQASTPLELTLPDGRVFWVIFNRTNGPAVTAKAVNDYTKASTDPDWRYEVTLRLLTVEPPA